MRTRMVVVILLSFTLLTSCSTLTDLATSAVTGAVVSDKPLVESNIQLGKTNNSKSIDGHSETLNNVDTLTSENMNIVVQNGIPITHAAMLFLIAWLIKEPDEIWNWLKSAIKRKRDKADDEKTA